jgi:ribosomal protein S12 methylthiotransferase
MKNQINIITLGCSKNVVDSENLATQLNSQGIKFVFDEFNYNSKTVVINTCGFIKDAKEESINTILEFAKAKNEGKIEKLYVIGCLSERYKADLEKEITEADKFFGVNDLKEIVETLKINYKKELLGERVISTPKHFAYLKISEGCDRTCAFCAIPLIRGKHVSVPMETLVSQAEYLAKNGVKELILIAQDLSYYGLDIYKEQKLAELLEKLSDIKELKIIRLHYAYPANFPWNVLDVMKKRKNIANYLDIPLQHISDNVLKQMRRGHNQKNTLELIKKLRTELPDISIRTTLLVGHPGETEEDFEELKQFVKNSRFERLGVFSYSEEEKTYGGENYKDIITEKVKNKRLDEIMQIQQKISLELNQSKIGKIFNVIIDGETDEYFVGRTEYDSPEVDNEVLISKTKKLKIGEIYEVKILSAEEFDLFGDLI